MSFPLDDGMARGTVTNPAQVNAGVINNTTRPADEGKDEAPGGGGVEAMLMRMMGTFQQRMDEQLSRQLEQQQQQFQHRMEQLEQATRKNAAYTATLSSTPYRPTHVSASAAMQRPPVRRQSMGIVAPTAPFTPGSLAGRSATPSSARAVLHDIMESLDDEHRAERGEGGGHSDGHSQPAASPAAQHPTLPVMSKEMREVRKAFVSTVKPYDGKTTTDFANVLEWVEKVDTEFSVLMGEVEDGRIELVRSRLQGSALVWVNREIARREKMGMASEWRDLRQPFVDAHLGVNTVETFKAELRALRWAAHDCKTPTSSTAQFDRLAELAFPTSQQMAPTAAGELLGEEYEAIVAQSQPPVAAHRARVNAHYAGRVEARRSAAWVERDHRRMAAARQARCHAAADESGAAWPGHAEAEARRQHGQRPRAAPRRGHSRRRRAVTRKASDTQLSAAAHSGARRGEAARWRA